MGRVESTVAVPVEQAQLIDPGAFRFDTSVAQAIQGAGAVPTELGERKKKMQDRLSVSDANLEMENAQLAYETEIQGKPLSEHAGILLKHQNAAKARIGQFKMTSETRQFIGQKVGAWASLNSSQQKLAEVKAIQRNADVAVIRDYGNALVNGTAEDIVETREAAAAQLGDCKRYAPHPYKPPRRFLSKLRCKTLRERRG